MCQHACASSKVWSAAGPCSCTCKQAAAPAPWPVPLQWTASQAYAHWCSPQVPASQVWVAGQPTWPLVQHSAEVMQVVPHSLGLSVGHVLGSVVRHLYAPLLSCLQVASAAAQHSVGMMLPGEQAEPVGTVHLRQVGWVSGHRGGSNAGQQAGGWGAEGCSGVEVEMRRRPVRWRLQRGSGGVGRHLGCAHRQRPGLPVLHGGHGMVTHWLAALAHRHAGSLGSVHLDRPLGLERALAKVLPPPPAVGPGMGLGGIRRGSIRRSRLNSALCACF